MKLKHLIGILTLGFLMTGCNRIPFGAIAGARRPQAYSAKTFMIMGQSNAVRFAKFGGPQAFTSAIQGFAPGPVSFIDCSVGGTALSQWQKGGSLYQDCVDAAQGKHIDGILWEQGEAEAEQVDDAICDAWTSNFTSFINSFRADIKSPSAVVLYCRLGQAKGLPNTQTVRSAQEAVHISNGHLVDLDSIPVPLGLHYLESDYPRIGNLYAKAYKELLGGE